MALAHVRFFVIVGPLLSNFIQVLGENSRKMEGIRKNPYKAAALALEVIPRTLIQNCGGCCFTNLLFRSVAGSMFTNIHCSYSKFYSYSSSLFGIQSFISFKFRLLWIRVFGFVKVTPFVKLRPCERSMRRQTQTGRGVSMDLPESWLVFHNSRKQEIPILLLRGNGN